MDRSRSAQKRGAIDDYLLDGESTDDADGDEATGFLWEDADLVDMESDSELDDQDLEIARLLGVSTIRNARLA